MLGGVVIKQAREEMYLEIILDPQLILNSHAKKICLATIQHQTRANV